MPEIKLYRNSKAEKYTYNVGENLMQILQTLGIKLTTPCGGNGTCGKCLVKVKDVGNVISCAYWPDMDIEVVVPTQRESKILTYQHQNTLKLPLETNMLAQKSAYPVGLGIDLGTTSIVFYWISLITGSLIKCTSAGNPQEKHGADVISRINYCSNVNGLKTLQKELIDVINSQIINFINSERLERDNITKVSVSANATMLHLLAGVNPGPIALVPFKAPFTDYKIFQPDQLGVNINQEGSIELLPSFSAYVGADIVSGLASLQPQGHIKNYLFLDIGTNGEMAFVTDNKIFCCATAAGPAFEGASISCGMGAFEGAISAYNHNGYSTIAGAKPVGICGSGILDIVAYLIETEVIKADGELANDFLIATEEESENGAAIVVTQNDIREIQLAKSAIYTGIKILLQEANISFHEVDAVYLAGGFGNYLNPESATKIGLIPHQMKDKIIPIGNTSGAGAILNTLSPKFIDYCNSVIEKSTLVDLAKHSDFEMEFAMNMYF